MSSVRTCVLYEARITDAGLLHRFNHADSFAAGFRLPANNTVSSRHPPSPELCRCGMVGDGATSINPPKSLSHFFYLILLSSGAVSYIFSTCYSPNCLLTIFNASCDMERPSKIYQSLAMPRHSRGKSRNLADTAPVAAKFEDCRQWFARLCVALETFFSPSDIALAEDSFAKFLAWGNDTGAMSQSLDHTLRKASAHQKKTLDLLTTLHLTLVEGMRLLILRYFSFGEVRKANINETEQQ